MERLGVGIIGASPLRPGWAVAAHIPALRALPQYEIRAVSTSDRNSAAAAHAAFSVPAYDNAEDLIRQADVDLVVVTVRLPSHHAIISAALEERKMVFSEWPLAVNSAQARDLKQRADTAELRTAVGLQARFSPQIQYASKLIEEGYIGKVLSTSLVGSASAWGGVTNRNSAYLFDDANGASPLTVSMMHALDGLNFMLGDFKRVSAITATRQTEVLVTDDGSTIPSTIADQVGLCGELQSGAVASVFYRGGQSRGDNLYWQITGSDGDLVFNAPTGNVQVGELVLRMGRGSETEVTAVDVPDPARALAPDIPRGFSSNVARLYLQLARDLQEGTHLTPDFSYACARHELVDSIRLTAATGQASRIERTTS